MAFAIARMAKQKGGSVGSSSLHNGRERETPNADPSKEKENRVILGQDKSTPELVREVIQEHGGKPRSDSVEAVEVVLTASPEWWRDDDDCIDRKKVDQFSKASKEFLSDRKNGGICVKATLHMDEHTPHIHAHMVPIDPEGKLNCKHYFGTRGKLSRWQDAFAEKVKPLGLERGEVGSRARHTDIKDFCGYSRSNEQGFLECVSQESVAPDSKYLSLRYGHGLTVTRNCNHACALTSL